MPRNWVHVYPLEQFLWKIPEHVGNIFENMGKDDQYTYVYGGPQGPRLVVSGDAISRGPWAAQPQELYGDAVWGYHMGISSGDIIWGDHMGEGNISRLGVIAPM